jgi:hypothetical protein
MPDRYADTKPFLPSAYVGFIETHSGWEGDLGTELESDHVVLWAKEAIQERWDAYEMERYLSDRWFPFGSDGGDEMLCFDLDSASDAVFWIPFIGMSDEEAMLRYNSFKDVVRSIAKKESEEGHYGRS